MDPGWATLPTARVTYRAFDLTSHFASEEPPKQLRVSLGMCKYGYQGSFCVGAHAANGACKAFLFSLHVTYSDGAVAVVESSAADGKWEATTTANPIRYSHLYHGEQFDGRVKQNSQWSPASLVTFNTGETGGEIIDADKFLGKPVLLTMPPLKVSKTYKPITVKNLGPSKWIFDMGNNMAGFAKLSVPRNALVPDQAVLLKYAEVTKSDGSCLLYTSPSPRDVEESRMPSSA